MAANNAARRTNNQQQQARPPRITADQFKAYLLDPQRFAQLEAISTVIDARTMVNLVFSACVKNPDIMQCDTHSLINAVLTAARWGLDPSGATKECWIIPRKGLATLQLGYFGVKELLLRTNRVLKIECHVVYPEDEFEIDLGTEPRIFHRPALNGAVRKEDDLVLAYMVATLRGGVTQFAYMEKWEIEKARNTSHQARGGPWTQWYGEMAKKTVLLRGAKLLPQTSVIATALAEAHDVEEGRYRRPAPTGARTAETDALESALGNGQPQEPQEPAQDQPAENGQAALPAPNPIEAGLSDFLRQGAGVRQ